MSYKNKPVWLASVLLLVLFSSTINAKSSKWHTLKALEPYSASEYTLKEGVEYLEIRSYIRSIQSKIYSDRYVVVAKFGNKTLDSFEPKVVEKFKASPPNLSEKTNIRKYGFCIMAGCTSYIGNAFMIDKNKKIWRMNEVSDVINMLGVVDTPAEVKLVLWLNDNHRSTNDMNHKDKYLKTSTGYSVLSEYDNSMSNLGECGLFTHEISINKQGKITQKKLLKRVNSPHGCLAMD